ncbi:proliferation marker protein Ki-67 isoform X2 [Heterodontus francisci]|uniref:proliferation marker protein Ki-67 isoform X2 n=1 Tax=Heterodontus francisci TaxID=7792 RepID=UPI00355B0A6C
MPLYGKIIVIKRTGADGYNFPLTSSSCLFGRKTDCDIRIQLPHVSKEHCKLEVNENNEVILTNLSEVNRTHLNGKVVFQSERLRHRDVFTVIDRSFRFEYPLDSVHNTSPRKKRSLSSLKNETLQVLHVQQGIDDASQPSGKRRQSTSGHKSDTVDVDKIFEAPTKSAKATPNERKGSAPKNLHRRSSKKILSDEQAADQEDLSPFSKLYEMFKQEVTKPIQAKPNEINVHVPVQENSTDLTKQTSVPAKTSSVTVSQYSKNSQASPSTRRMSGRASKIMLEEGKIAKDNKYEEMSNAETLLIEDVATGGLAKPTADRNTLKKNNVSVELNKFTENPPSEAKVTLLAFSDVGLKGEEQNNHLSPKGTSKVKQKSPYFTGRKSLTAGEALKELQEILEPSVDQERSLAMQTKAVEMEQIPVNVGKEKTETPKKRGRSSIRNKNVETADIQSEQAESNALEPTAAKSEVDKLIEMEHTPANVSKERAETPKKRGRSSIRNKNVETAHIQSKQAESNASEPTAAKSEVDKSVEMEHTPANVSKERAETPKKRGRSSIRNKNVETADIQSERAESNASEPTAAKSEVDKLVEMEHTPANVSKERAETPKKRGRSSIRNKNVETADIQSEQAESNASEPTAAKSEVDKSVEMEHMPANVSKERAETPKKRGRSSLHNQNVEAADIQSKQAESNASEPTAAKSEAEDKSVEVEHVPANVGKERAETPKRRGRSLHNKSVEVAGIEAEQSKSAEISEPSTAVKAVETPKKCGRLSLRNKNVETTDIRTGQAESAEISETLAATMSPALIKRKSDTSPSSRRLLSKRQESDVPEYLTKTECWKRKSQVSQSPQQDLTNEKTVAGGDPISPLNTVTEKLEKFSSVDVGLDLYANSKESPSSPVAVPYLSKKRRGENVEIFYGQIFKRKRVSFGVNLSPEVFDKRMPPSSPLRKGGTPVRVSTPFRCTPRTVLKGASSKGIRTCAIQEFSELNENHLSPMRPSVPSVNASPSQCKKPPAKVPSPGKGFLLTTGVKSPGKRPSSVKMSASTKTPCLLVIKQSPDAPTPLSVKTPSLPSTKRSPAARTPSQSKTPSSTKKSSVTKMLPTLSSKKLVTNEISSLIAEGSFDCSPRVRGRFSISQVATTPVLTRSKSPHITPTSLKQTLFEQPQQKPSLVATSGKKTSRKSTRRSGSLLAAMRSRRQTGASAANLLVTKSWAQIVKEGVAKPQLRCAGKKSAAVQRRTKNIVSSKVTPVRLVKGHFSTGHAASPATIVIGKSQATTIKPTGQAPQVLRTVSLRHKDYEMDESFTGVAEMFRTPTNENESTYPVLCTSNIVDTQTVLANSITQQSFEDSIIKTPEETGVMTVSPLTIRDTRNSREYNNSVSRLLRCRADFSSSLNDLCGSIPKVPKVKGKPVEDMVGVKRIMKTPRVKGRSVKDVVGVKRTMKTPRIKGKPVEDMVGVKRIMKTPRVKGKPVEDMVGVKRIMKTPRIKGKPVEDMVGVKRIMKTPRVKEKPVENFAGLQKLLAETKQKAESPEVSYVGIKNLFHSEKEMESCDYSGLGEMFSTPIKTGERLDSKQQSSKRISSKEVTNKPSMLEKIYRDEQTTETSENKSRQIVEQHSGQSSATKTPPRETGGNSSLTSGVKVTGKRPIRVKNETTSASKEECMQQPGQPAISQMLPEDSCVDFSDGEITESKDGQAVVTKLISPMRRYSKERKEMKDAGGEESPITKSATPDKNGCPVEYTEEVNKMVSTRKSLKAKKVKDADVKMPLTPNKTASDKKEPPHDQTEEVIALKPQTRRSLKEKGGIQDVELEKLPASTKKIIQDVHDADVKMSLTPNKTASGKKEPPHEQTEEVIALKPQARRSLKEKGGIQDVELEKLPASTKKIIQDVHDADVKISLTPNKTATGKKEPPHEQTEEVIALKPQTRRSLKEKGGIQDVELEKLPASTKKIIQDVHDADVKISLTPNKTASGKKEPPHEQTEEVIALKPQTRRSLKEKGGIQDVELEKLPASTKKIIQDVHDADVKMSLTPNKTASGKKEPPHEQTEEVIALKPQTRRSLKEKGGIQDVELEKLPASTKKIIQDVHDADVKMSLTPNKTASGKKEPPHEQTEEVIALKPQTRRSLKEKCGIQNVPNVELEELPSSVIKGTTSIKNESPGKKIDEVNMLVSPITKSLRGKKKAQNVHSAEMKELFTLSKTTPDKKGSQGGQIGEVNEITSIRKSLEGKKEIQNIQEVEVISPPTSAKTCKQDEKHIPVPQIEKVVHLTSRKIPQRRRKETESTQVEKPPAVAKTSRGKRESQHAQIEKLDNSSLRMISQETNDKNVESRKMKNRHDSPKTSTEDIEKVKDLPFEDVKVFITTGRPQRRKNINVEETGVHKPGTTNGYTRKRGARCARDENVKESINLQNGLRDQEEVDKAGVSSGPEESVRDGAKTENVKILEKDLASSKYRSRRGKRGIKDLLLDEVRQDSVPAKRLRKEEELDEAPLRKTVHWDSNAASPKLADCAVETLQETFNGTELPALERRSRRGKAAKKQVNPQASLASVGMSRKAVSKHANSKVTTDANIFHESAEQKGRPKRNKTDVQCELQEKKDKCKDAENVNEGTPAMKKMNQHTEYVLKLSPTQIKRSLRGKVGQKVTQIKEEHLKELSSRKSTRNTRRQKLVATTGEEPHVPVRGASGKEDKHKMTMPSSRTMEKKKQAKKSLVECEAVPEQTEQQLNVITANVQLDTASEQVLQENEPVAQKVKSKAGQRAKALPKRTMSNIEDIAVGEMAGQKKRNHLNVPVGGSGVIDNSDTPSKAEATKQTRISSKGKVTNTAARVSEVTSDTKKMDVVLSNGYEIRENARPKRGVRKGRSAKEIATETEVKNLVPDPAEEIAERWNLSKRASKESSQTEEAAQKTKLDSKMPAISKRSKRKITKEDALSVVQAISEEGLQIEDKVVDPVKAPRKGGRGMVKRNTSAVINEELSMGATENKQVIVSSANKAEKNKRARRGQNYVEGNAIMIAEVGKDELIDKRGRRTNLAACTNGDENLQSRKDIVEDKGKQQDTGFLPVESSKPAKRATRANKFCEAAAIEPISIQPLASAALKAASLRSSKRTFRGNCAVEETTDVSPKRSKMEKLTGKVMTQGRRTGKASVSTKNTLPVTPQPAKPTGRSTRSRK